MKSKIIAIQGDASFRKFYRITLEKKNKIIVTAKKNKYKNLIVYAAINNFLIQNKINAPKLYSHNYTKGILIIEDFGDLSFRQILVKKNNKLKIYKKIVDLLLKIQRIKPKTKIKNIYNKNYILKKYSTNFLHSESDLFFQWYLPLFLSRKKTLIIKKKVKKILSKLYKKIYFPNSHFVHRDYHVENLMKVGNKIGVIDSQDALIGNPAYDLVSLIDDVRIKTSKMLKKKIYNYYIKKTFSIYRNNQENFENDFNILSIQRSLKIIGIFARLFKRDKKKKYLKYIPYMWKLLENRMGSRLFMELQKILDENIKKNNRQKVFYK